MSEVATAPAERRYHTSTGEQIVRIDRWTYLWSGAEPLAVGDDVMLPENWLSEIKYGPGLVFGTITALGSTYSGDLSTIVRRATESDREKWCAEPKPLEPMHPDPAHRHDVRWNYYNPRELGGGSYISINVYLDCGCAIDDIRVFAAEMRAQKGWVIATSVGWSGHGSTYTVRALRNSLR